MYKSMIMNKEHIFINFNINQLMTAYVKENDFRYLPNHFRKSLNHLNVLPASFHQFQSQPKWVL